MASMAWASRSTRLAMSWCRGFGTRRGSLASGRPGWRSSSHGEEVGHTLVESARAGDVPASTRTHPPASRVGRPSELVEAEVVRRHRAGRSLAAGVITLMILAGCGAMPESDAGFVEYGSMREALREGKSEGRVVLDGMAARNAIGVGAMEGLRGEVTILDGRVLVATADGATCRVADAAPGASATLLFRQEVARFEERPLGDCASYEELEEKIATVLERDGFDLLKPTPIRLRGRASSVEYHVVAGACPIANPDGPPPWRFSGPLDPVELVGFYVEDAAGRITHHHHQSHLHVVADGHTGHLDAVSLSGAVLLVPAR